MGSGGLIRYSEEEKELIRVKPTHVIVIVALVVVMEIILKVAFS
jgi:preprotein translocase subunit Sec61beta